MNRVIRKYGLLYLLLICTSCTILNHEKQNTEIVFTNSFENFVPCLICGGQKLCPICNGNKYFFWILQCPHCNGKGVCPICHGKGQRRE